LIKVVLDTNVYISGILFGGNSRRILDLIIEGKLRLFVTDEILDELRGVLQRKKFDFPKKRAWSGNRRWPRDERFL